MVRKTLLTVLVFFVITKMSFADVKIAGTVMDYNNDTHYKTYLKYILVNPDKQTDPKFVNDDIAYIKANLEDPIRREIFDRESASTTVFTFAALADAINHWNLRLNTIANMNAMKAGGTWAYDYRELKKPATTTSGKWNPGAAVDFNFKVKPGQTSYAAIVDLASATTKGECAGAITACIFKAAADVLGQKAFDALHPAGTLELGWGNQTEINKHLTFVSGADITDETKHIPGDYVYMSNKSDFDDKIKAKKVQSDWRGENCLYVGGGKYSGLGLWDKTSDQLRQRLAEAYKDKTGDDVPNPLSDYIKWTSRATLKVQ